jgi:hypothetical protein
MDIKKFENFKSDLAGWVNVKIDNQLGKRMSRYIPALDRLSKGNKYNLAKKIDILSNVDIHLADTNVSLRDKISIITILQYLKEIRNKDQFNASSSGFLLESFFAGLVYGDVTNDYGPSDISTSYSELIPLIYKSNDENTNLRKLDFQIKLYKENSDIKVNFEKLCDFYVICIKKTDSISVHILDGKRSKFGKSENTYYIGRYARKKRGTNEFLRGEEDGKKFIIIDTKKLERENKHRRELNVGDIDSLIKECGDKIQETITYLYDNLSELHYNIDSIIVGTDRNKKPIDVDTAAERAIRTVSIISDEINNLKINLNNKK